MTCPRSSLPSLMTARQSIGSHTGVLVGRAPPFRCHSETRGESGFENSHIKTRTGRAVSPVPYFCTLTKERDTHTQREREGGIHFLLHLPQTPPLPVVFPPRHTYRQQYGLSQVIYEYKAQRQPCAHGILRPSDR